jgi:hypothetical protein
VYIQIEFLGLSRSVPPVFAWLVNPYTRSVPTDYLTHYIVATRKALQEASAAKAAHRTSQVAVICPESAG